ncbi:listerin E3 ubiquitin protein ligase 1 [Rhizophlyctis rosea]|nr:listerin E3 ubiquitin protein ligase 1 [Rhizophlyctis rosea]
MGKKDVKKEGRVKGNLQPAASSRAAELMSSGFGGFGGLAPTSFGFGGDEFAEVDTELKVIFKKLSKRDSVTRVKGLEELSAYLENATIEDIQAMLPSWAKLYNRLGTDVERRVRENTGHVHLVLVRKARKHLAPILKEIVGTWLTLRFDPAKDVAKSAADAFQEAFPSKQTDVLVFCQVEILEYLIENLLNTTAETLSDPRYTTPEDMTARFGRVISGCLYLLSWMLEQLSSDLLQKASGQYDQLLDDKRFWSLLQHELSPIRRAAYVFIKTASVQWPGALEIRLSVISLAFVGKVFLEKDTATHSDMWEALVTFLRTFGTAWDVASQKKPVLPKLSTFLKNGAYGSISITYPSLLPFLSVMPVEVISDAAFQKEFLTNFWTGLNSGAIENANSKLFIESYVECGLFLAIKSGFEPETARQILDVHLFTPVEAFLLPSKHGNAKDKVKPEVLGDAITNFVVKIGTSTQVPSKSSSAYVCHIRDVVVEQLESAPSSTSKDFEVLCIRADRLFQSMGDAVKQKGEAANILKDNIVSAVTVIFARSIELLSPDRLSGSSILLCGLAESFTEELFTDARCHDLVLQMCKVKLAEMEKVDPPVLGRFFKVAIACMGVISAKEPTICTTVWDGLLDILGHLDEAHRSVVFNDMLVELRRVELASTYDLRSERLDVAVLLLLDHADEKDGDQRRANESALALALKPDSIVSTNASEMAGHQFSIALAAMQTPQYAKYLNKAQFTLNVLEQLLGYGKPVSTIFDAETQRDLLLNISELAAYGVATDEHVEEVERLRRSAVACWKAYAGIAKLGGEDELRSVSQLLLEHWKSLFCDLKHHGRPEQYVSQIENILDLTGELDTLKQDVWQTVLHSPEYWRHLGSAWDQDDVLLVIEDPLVAVSSNSGKKDAGTDFDVHGFSLYARLAFTVAELMQKRWEEMKGFVGEFGWVGVELMRLWVVWEDAGRLEGRMPWQVDAGDVLSREGLWGIFGKVVAEGGRGDEVGWLEEFVGLPKGTVVGEDKRRSALLAAVQGGFDGKGLRVLAQLVTLMNSAPSSSDRWISVIEKAIDCGRPKIALSLLAGVQDILPVAALPKLLTKTVQSISQLDKATVFDGTSSAVALVTSAGILLQRLSDNQSIIDTPQAQLVLLTRQLRSWYEGADGYRISKASRLDVAVGGVLAKVVGMQGEVGVNLAGFIFAICERWILELSMTNPDTRVVLHEVLQLWEALLRAADQEPQVWGAVDRHEQQVQSHVLELFQGLAGVKDHSPTAKPQAKFSTQLAELAGNTREEILFEIGSTRQLADLLYLPNEAVQLTAFSLLRRLTRKYVQETSLKVEMRRSDDESQGEEKLPEEVISAAVKQVADVEPGTVDFAAHAGLGYLLSWMILLGHFDDATFQLKANYISHLRTSDSLAHFLEYIFGMLGVGWSSSPFDLARWDFQNFEPEAFELSSPVGFPLLAAHLYWRILRHAPSLVRIWWMECKNRQLTLAVENYTTKHYTSELVRTEMDSLSTADKSALEDLTIKASKQSNEVTAAYAIEDTNLEIVIRYPQNFPLRQIDVDAGKASGGRNAGVGEARWRGWLLSTSAVMVAQNGSVVDALGVFRKNIALHFEGGFCGAFWEGFSLFAEQLGWSFFLLIFYFVLFLGVEDCAICYSVIGVIDRTLPTKQCKTCKHLFHASCLYKV